MAAMFGHQWTSQYGDTPNGKGGETWAACLAGITPAMVAEGFRALRDSGREWPPSAPAFRRMCFGIPSKRQVTLELSRDCEKSRFARLTWSKLDHYRLARAESSEAERMISDAYEVALQHILAGEGYLPEPVALIPAQDEPHKPASPEVARRYLDEIRDVLGASGEA